MFNLILKHQSEKEKLEYWTHLWKVFKLNIIFSFFTDSFAEPKI
jgi:hypothetical protein